ncbi:GntR family transcriptional regulator [Lonsdalea iberica]|uniref:HTH gntR-type domain-containing protein n=1 Tax=Lonsdalea iberica TaxID=1082703 RepID=A0A1X3RU04_9GAMM|nr:GntR family transcriptional regulator [Lonsdalea iberica]OSN05395.1 hypothetical protein AU511_09915 [Lonsdalea iberica]
MTLYPPWIQEEEMDKYSALVERLQHRLQQRDHTPLYVKFSDALQQAVQNGDLREGDFLPSEREFCRLLGISRITVRNALKLLESRNVVVRTRGYGTYINFQMEYQIGSAASFSCQVTGKGKNPGTMWLEKKVVPCNEEVAEQLALPPDTPVYCLLRHRFIEDEPVSIVTSYVPTTLIGNPEEIGVSLYAYFKAQNISPQHTRNWVTAKASDEHFVSVMNIKASVPMLVLKQQVCDGAGVPIEFSINHCRADRYVFVSER